MARVLEMGASCKEKRGQKVRIGLEDTKAPAETFLTFMMETKILRGDMIDIKVLKKSTIGTNNR